MHSVEGSHVFAVCTLSPSPCLRLHDSPSRVSIEEQTFSRRCVTLWFPSYHDPIVDLCVSQTRSVPINVPLALPCFADVYATAQC